jgi:hypothetical protein
VRAPSQGHRFHTQWYLEAPHRALTSESKNVA